jgi:flagellar basal body-associated protein FliL
MPEEKTPVAEAPSAQKESKVSMMMIILLVILIWAVVAYFMTMTPGKDGEAQQHAATTEQAAPEVTAPVTAEKTSMDAPVAVEATQKPVAITVVKVKKVPAKNEKEAVDVLMDVFAPSGK